MKSLSPKVFLVQEEDHVCEANWDNIINIDDSSGNSFNLATHYGQFSIMECKSCAINNWIDKSNRQSQNSMQMYVFLRGYLTADSFSRVIIRADEYTCNGTPDGPTFLKVVLSTYHVYSRAAVSILHEKLSSLDTYIVSIDSNTYISNDYVKTQIHVLTSREEK